MDARRSDAGWPARWMVLALVVALAGCSAATPSSPAGSAAPGGAPASPTPAASSAAAGPGVTPPVDAGAPVEAPADAPTVIDVPSAVAADTTVTPDGGVVSGAGATITVPRGAVSADTKLTVTRLDGPYHQSPFARDDDGALKAVAIGTPVDVGPAGVTFAAPVTVTVPYDPAAIPDGYDTVALAYWTGTRWSALGGTVDPKAHTVSVALTGFSGEILTTIAVATGVGLVIHAGIKWYYGKEGTNSDPISEKKAAGWVTPKDPTVAAAAKGATVGGVPLSDPKALAAWLAANAGKGPATIAVKGADGADHTQQYSSGTNTNWQTPADYLGKNGMKGDCTDVTNALVSVFRAAGYPAKAVFGYAGDRDSPHAWGEVSIGGKPYLIDEEGHLQPLADAIKAANLIRPDKDDPRGFMWDERGQVPYDEDWWSLAEINGTWTGTFTITDITLDEQAQKDAENQGCTIGMLAALKGQALPFTMKIKVDKAGKGEATILIDTSKIKDKNGKPLGSKPDPQTLKVTYDGITLTFKVDASGGTTTRMSGTVTGDTIAGSMVVSGKGFSATAAWSVGR